MNQITLDADVSNKLIHVDQTVELCDPTGRVLGRFVPLSDLAEWEPVSPPATEEELDRRESANERRYTTAEVIAHLERI